MPCKMARLAMGGFGRGVWERYHSMMFMLEVCWFGSVARGGWRQ
jgi:hypothetical protein